MGRGSRLDDAKSGGEEVRVVGLKHSRNIYKTRGICASARDEEEEEEKVGRKGRDEMGRRKERTRKWGCTRTTPDYVNEKRTIREGEN
jgi:hypothetical protein